MAVIYILYSKQIDSYYIGSCLDMEERLKQHLGKEYPSSFTARADDWKVYLKIGDIEYKKARQIEAHIKKMKSRKYIENLSKYPELIKKLKLKEY